MSDKNELRNNKKESFRLNENARKRIDNEFFGQPSELISREEQNRRGKKSQNKSSAKKKDRCGKGKVNRIP